MNTVELTCPMDDAVAMVYLGERDAKSTVELNDSLGLWAAQDERADIRHSGIIARKRGSADGSSPVEAVADNAVRTPGITT